MFSKTLVAIALASLSLGRMTNSRRHMNVAEVQRRDKPSTYAEGYLEPYDTYHTRYLAVGCKGQQGTTFFDDCCHPMLATETLANNRKAYCNPANKKASSSSSAAPAGPTTNGANDNTDGGDDDCEDDGDDNGDGNGDDDETCEDGGDDDNNDGGNTNNNDDVPVTASSAAPITSSAAPAPTSHKATSTTSKKAAAPTSSPSGGNGGSKGSGDVKDGGFATYFYQGGNAGACGNYNQDSAVVAAIDSAIYSGGSHCGKKIVITRKDTGKSVTVTVADECPTCVNANSIDLSVGAFKQIATESEGMVPITWQWAS